LPYGNKQFSMTLVMPGGSGTADDLLRNLTAANVSQWLEAADSSNLQLFLPKFKLEYEKNLNQPLKDLGMPEAFGSGADFSGMITGFRKGDLAISEVKHKSFVEVDEEGTEAAAVTSIGIVVTSLPPSIRFDRPFVFLIREKASGAILFIGKLARPH
jgi:serpin B